MVDYPLPRKHQTEAKRTQEHKVGINDGNFSVNGIFFSFGTPTLLTITLINNYTIYKSIQYSTYITYNPI